MSDCNRTTSSVSAKKLAANRRNARKSTGPRTTAGKARAAKNSTSHGIFCADLLMEGEDAELFRLTRESFIRSLKPQDACELALVDGAFAARWRLNRCQHAEASLIDEHTRRARETLVCEMERLENNMRFDDLTQVALAAKCEQDGSFARFHARWKELRELERRGVHPGGAVASLVQTEGDQPLERLSRYEHRLEGQFHRNLRDLHVLKQRAKQYAAEPESPFLGGRVVEEDEGAGGTPVQDVEADHMRGAEGASGLPADWEVRERDVAESAASPTPRVTRSFPVEEEAGVQNEATEVARDARDVVNGTWGRGEEGGGGVRGRGGPMESGRCGGVRGGRRE